MRFWNIPTLLIFWALLTVFLGRFLLLDQAIYGDGIYYWSYVRSLVVDGDWDLRNEASHNYSPQGNNSVLENLPAKESLIASKYYPIGTSIMWSPAFILAHGISTPLGMLQNGYADHYQVAVGVLNITYIVIGLTLLYRILRKFYSHFVTSISVILILFATNLFYYGSLDVLNSHPSSFFISCVLITCLFSLKKEVTNRKLFLSGLTLGLLVLIRPQDALFVLLFLPFFVMRNLQIIPRWVMLFVLGAAISYLPQIIASRILYGTVFATPYLTGGGAFHLLDPHIVELFFSTERGLLFFSPLYIVGILGLFFYAKQGNLFGKRFLLLFLLVVLLISVWSGWNQGEAYGLRMLISMLPIFAFGIAEVVTSLVKKLSKTTLIVLAVIFILQNFLMIFSFHLFLHNPTFIQGEVTDGGKLRMEIFERVRDLIQK